MTPIKTLDHTPSDTDKMEWEDQIIDALEWYAIGWSKANDGNITGELLQKESYESIQEIIQKAADGARVKVVEEIREHVGNSVCPCRLDEYYPPHASKHAYYEGMNFVLNILDFLTDTNTKEGR